MRLDHTISMISETAAYIACMLGSDLAQIVIGFISREFVWWQIIRYGFSVAAPPTRCDISAASAVPLYWYARWCDICCSIASVIAIVADRSDYEFSVCARCSLLVIAPSISLRLPSFTIISIYDGSRDLYCVEVQLVRRRERRNLNPRRRQRCKLMPWSAS
jgi:hypothetical protein